MSGAGAGLTRREALRAGGAALLLGLAAPRLAFAGGAKYVVQVTQILATEEGVQGPKAIDALLGDLASQLEKYDYRVFARKGIEKRTQGDGEPEVYDLSEDPGFTIYVRPHTEKARLVLDLRLRNPKREEITVADVAVKDGGTAIVAKELDSRKGRLFIAVTVKREG